MYTYPYDVYKKQIINAYQFIFIILRVPSLFFTVWNTPILLLYNYMLNAGIKK